MPGSTITLILMQVILLLISFLIQYFVIHPVESLFTDPTSSTIVSYLFLPHGVKAILLALSGPVALIPVFISQFIADLAMGYTSTYSFVSAFESSVAFLLPLVLLNYLVNRNTLSTLRLDVEFNISLVRIVLFVAVIQAFANSMIRSVIHDDAQLELLSFRYLLGDISGTVAVLALVVLFRRPIVRIASALLTR